MDRDQQRMDAAARLVLGRMPLMTTERELMERVMEAAREIADQLLLAEMTIEDRCDADVEGAYDAMIERMRPLIHALDALPAPAPAGKTVTLAMWEDHTGRVLWARAGTPADGEDTFAFRWTRVGTVTLPLTVEPPADG